jgi:nitrogenase molybdenum-iron protein alpha/beta subunit
MEGRRGTVSYLHLTEESIVSGDYEQEVLEAADLLIAMRTGRGRRPQGVSRFLSGLAPHRRTERDAIWGGGGVEYPETDTGVNIIGVLQELHPDMEIFEVLRRMGAQEVRHISDYDTYAGYQSMARSRLNIVVAPPGKYASRNMQQKLGIPFVMALTAFRPENITKTYGQIAQAMGAQCPDLTAYESAAENALKETARALGDVKIIVDGEAVNRPFEFARALIEAGFTVHSIYEQKLIPADEEDFQWVRENHPEIPIYQPQHPKMTTAEKTTEECVAVGYSAGYLSGARHVVDLGGQNGLYGYRGVVRLMEMIRKAAAEEADMKKMLQDTVLVI